MKAQRIRGLTADLPLETAARRFVSVRTAELYAFVPEALDEEAITAMHDMRIAAKRLRYLLELVGFCFGDVGSEAQGRARQLQDVLGEIHDCDVMLPRAEGIESLATLLRTRRELLFRRFHDLWQAEASKGTWVALERSL